MESRPISFASPCVRCAAAHDRDRTLPGALPALHAILWKFVLIAFTRVDTDSATFEPVNVWLQGYRQYAASDATSKP